MATMLNVCIFCCKSVLIEDKVKESSPSVLKFLKLLDRFVNGGEELVFSSQNANLQHCKDCANLSVTFCKVFHEIQCLELQLLFKLETLMAVMRAADKVPSRMALLNNYFVSDCETNVNTMTAQSFKKIRKEIFNKCNLSKVLSRLQPRVVLQKLRPKDKIPNINNVKTEHLTALPNIVSTNNNDRVNWLLSFAAIYSLVSSFIPLDTFDNYRETVNFLIFDDENDLEVFTSGDVFNEMDTESNSDINVASDEADASGNYTSQPNLEKSLNESTGESNNMTASAVELDNENLMETSSEIHSATEENEMETVSTNQELKVQISQNDIPETMVINSTKKKPFKCSRCKKTFTIKNALENHIKRRHRGILIPRKNLIKKDKTTNSNFHCKLCKSTHPSYESFRAHKRNFLHRYLEKRSFPKIKAEPQAKNSQQIHNLPENQEKNFTSSCDLDDDSVDIKNIFEQENKEGRRYNLRKNLNRSYASNFETMENTNSEDSYQNSDTESNFVENLDQISSSDTDSSDQDSDDTSISSHDEVDDKLDRKNIGDKRYYYCHLDDCKYRISFFSNDNYLKEHQKLHQRGKFSCNFCDKIEVTVIKLALHESKTHSVFNSTSSGKSRGESIIHCARCSFETKMEGVYLRHFASVHVPIYDANIGRTVQHCEICNRKLVTKHGAERHFKLNHDTSGLDDPEKQIRKCKVEGCKAYFLSSAQLWNHKHWEHVSSLQNNEENDNMDIDEKEMETFKCSFCSKRFSTLQILFQHKRTFHKRQDQLLPEVKSEIPNDNVRNIKRLICPEIKCTKNFATKKGLEVHKNLHGKFTCNFCDHILDYAPDLAYHEYELHCIVNPDEELQHPNLGKFKCPRCPKVVKNRLPYMYHFVNDHLGLSTVHAVCSICKHENNLETLHYHNMDSHNIKDLHPSEVSRCSRCPAYFRTKNQLIRHNNKIHCYDVSRKCLKCNRVFRDQNSLEMHNKQVHATGNENTKIKKKNIYPCVLDRCKRNFTSKAALDRHQKLHERGHYPCKFCDTVHDTVLKLFFHETLRHVNSKQKDTTGYRFFCSRCFYNSYYVINVQNHFAIKHTKTLEKKKNLNNLKKQTEVELKFTCATCGIEVSSPKDLAIHETTHTVNEVKKGTRCPRCLKPYKKESYVNHFIKKHLGIRSKHKLKRETCPVCQDVTSRQSKHFSAFHDTSNLDDPSKIFKCGVNGCEAYFVKDLQLIRHNNKMHSDNFLSCKFCEKGLKNKSALKVHIANSHPYIDANIELPLSCDLENCQERFSTEAELQWHKRYDLHSKDKNGNLDEFKCEKCDKVFSAKNKLQIHVSQVHSDKSFICPECGKKFKIKNSLETHLEYHKGPESWKFQCATCGKKCADKPKLKQHIRTHTKEKPFVCQHCGEKYAHRHNWKNHMLKKHKDKNDLPETRKRLKVNQPSRKGLKKGDCVISGVKQ